MAQPRSIGHDPDTELVEDDAPDSAALDLPSQAAVPHRLANDLTQETSVQAGPPATTPTRPSSDISRASEVNRDRNRDQMFKPVERHLASKAGLVIVGVVILGLIVAALITVQWVLLGVAALVFIPFMLFLMAPVLLAEGTKTAQDDAVRDSNRGTGR